MEMSSELTGYLKNVRIAVAVAILKMKPNGWSGEKFAQFLRSSAIAKLQISGKAQENGSIAALPNGEMLIFSYVTDELPECVWRAIRPHVNIIIRNIVQQIASTDPFTQEKYVGELKRSLTGLVSCQRLRCLALKNVIDALGQVTSDLVQHQASKAHEKLELCGVFASVAMNLLQCQKAMVADAALSAQMVDIVRFSIAHLHQGHPLLAEIIWQIHSLFTARNSS